MKFPRALAIQQFDNSYLSSVMDVAGSHSFDEHSITIVSGLPRSGTSMMMQMLSAGGVVPLTDGKRETDSRNPKGYYEYEAVKDQRPYDQWLAKAHGKSLKVVSRFIKRLPATYRYNVVFMRRDLTQVVRSQGDLSRFRSGTAMPPEDAAKLTTSYETHLDDVLRWIRQRPNMRMIEVQFEEMIGNPAGQAAALAEFLTAMSLDVPSMMATVDPALSHHKIVGR